MAYPKKYKTEHSGAKNMSHDKWDFREDLKRDSKKVRRQQDKLEVSRELSEEETDREEE